MYMMTCTRPDLAYLLSLLARYAAPDASWVDDSATQRSSQGYTFSLGSGSVSWRSTRSSSVLISSCEAEIYAGAMAAQELRWLTYLLTDLGEQPRSPPQRGQLRLAYVATRANTADIFTKALQTACFAFLDWTCPVSAEALHTFTLDSGASSCFFHDCTTVTPLAAPVSVSLADPTGGRVVARASTVLPCPAVPSGSLSGLHLPVFLMNQLSNAVLQDEWVDTFIPGGHRVAICTCSRTGRHLATFTRHPEHWHALASPCLWPSQVPPLPPVLAFPAVPSLRRGAVARRSSLLRVSSDHCSSADSPHGSFGPSPRRWDGPGALLPLRERFRRDFPVLRLHSDRGGKVGDASVFWVWGALSLVRDAKASKLSSRTLHCVFLGFPTDAPPWQFYHPRERRVFSSHYVTFDEAVCFYRLHPNASHSVPLAPLFLAPVPPPPVDPLPPQGPAPSGEGGDPAADDTVATRRSPRLETPPGFPPRPSSPPPQPTTEDSGAKTAGAEPGGVGTEGEGSRSVASGGAATGGADSGGAASPSGGGAVGDPAGGLGDGQPPQPDLLETLSLQVIRTAGGGGTGGTAGGAGGAAGAGGTRGANGAGGASAISPRGSTGAGGAGPTCLGGTAGAGGARGAAGAGGVGAGVTRGSGAAGPGGAHTGGARAIGASGAVSAGGAGGTGAAGTGSAGATGVGAAGAAGPGGARTRGTRTKGAGAAGAGGAASAGGAGGATGAAGSGGARGTAGPGGAEAGGTGGTGGAGAACPGGARTRGAGAAGAGGAAGARGVGGATGAAGTGGAGGTAGAGGTGAGGIGGGAASAGGAGGATGATGTGAAGGTAGARGACATGACGTSGGGGATGAAGAGGAGAIVVEELELLVLPCADRFSTCSRSRPSRCLTRSFARFLLLPGSPLPAPAPHTEVTESLTERREPETRASTLVRARRIARPRPPAVTGTHSMTLRPSSVPQRVVLPQPPASSLPQVPDPESDLARAASSTLVDFAARSRLDYVASLVTESGSVCPPSVGGELALGSDVLEDRQFELECLVAALPRFASMLLCPEGDPDSLDIPSPRSYAEAIAGEYSSQWQTAMDAEMASWKSTGTYVDEFPPPGANIVDGMWIFRVKRPPGFPLAFKAHYVARGFSQRQGVDFFHTFSPTPKMTTLRVLLHVAAQRDYELHSLDFSTAFLQGSLHEEIWLRCPPGFTGSSPAGTRWSLRRPVYGLRHAPREWRIMGRGVMCAVRHGQCGVAWEEGTKASTGLSEPPFKPPLPICVSALSILCCCSPCSLHALAPPFIPSSPSSPLMPPCPFLPSEPSLTHFLLALFLG
ncbi:unnamed protein product [Closterium sp. NIES-53]